MTILAIDPVELDLDTPVFIVQFVTGTIRRWTVRDLRTRARGLLWPPREGTMFDTWAAAHAALIATWEEKRDWQEQELTRTNQRLEQLRALTEAQA